MFGNCEFGFGSVDMFVSLKAFVIRAAVFVVLWILAIILMKGDRMKRYDVYHGVEYQGFVIAKNDKKALDEAIGRYGRHPALTVKLSSSIKVRA